MRTVDITRPSYEILKYPRSQRRVACYVWAKRNNSVLKGP